MKARKVIDRIYGVLTRRVVYHGLFWLVFYAVLVWLAQAEQAFVFTLANEFLDLLFYAVLVYFNLLFLIPNYLAKKTFIYLGLAIATCALLTPIKVFVFYLKYGGNDALQMDLVKGQGAVFVTSFGVLMMSTILNIVTGWWRYQQEKQTLLTQNMQSELRFLKSQINPHFLFNTLNNLYSLTLTKNDKAPETVLKLAEIMRYMLYECNEKQVLLSREIQYMQNYLDLERLRQPANTEMSLVTEGDISDQNIAPLMFIPFLENAFKHGVNSTVSPNAYVRARIRVQGEDLEFFIENSKPEHVPKPEHRRSGGIGLANVRQRLELLYPGKYDLDIQNEPRRYTATLLLKL